MAICPNGHQTQATDYCDVCGAPMGSAVSDPAVAAEQLVGDAPGAVDQAAVLTGGVQPGLTDAPASPNAATKPCPNCQAINPGSALFCEACGYDFTTGALPRGAQPDAPAPAVPGDATCGGVAGGAAPGAGDLGLATGAAAGGAAPAGDLAPQAPAAPLPTTSAQDAAPVPNPLDLDAPAPSLGAAHDAAHAGGAVTPSGVVGDEAEPAHDASLLDPPAPNADLADPKAALDATPAPTDAAALAPDTVPAGQTPLTADAAAAPVEPAAAVGPTPAPGTPDVAAEDAPASDVPGAGAAPSGVPATDVPVAEPLDFDAPADAPIVVSGQPDSLPAADADADAQLPSADAQPAPVDDADAPVAGVVASAPRSAQDVPPVPEPASPAVDAPAQPVDDVQAPATAGVEAAPAVPAATASAVPSSPVAAEPPASGPAEWVAEVWIDPDWYAGQSSPDQLPSPGLPRVVGLRKKASLIGRPSKSRGIEPEVDCEPDTGVSRKHAELTTDGTRWYVEDLGSSNGTYVGRAGAPLPEKPITGRTELSEDARVYVGSWTRIVVRRANPDEAEL